MKKHIGTPPRPRKNRYKTKAAANLASKALPYSTMVFDSGPTALYADVEKGFVIVNLTTPQAGADNIAQVKLSLDNAHDFAMELLRICQ